VLGLVGRDLLLDTMDAVAAEDAPASFAIAARAVEMGYDLRAVCRELSRLVRDVLVLSVDSSRIEDPEIAGESERDRLKALVGRFSREDLLRAFDLLTRAEQDIKSSAQPRYQLEMALLRWIHLRKLMPIEDLIAGVGGPERATPRPPVAPARTAGPQAPSPRTPAPASVGRQAPAAPASPAAVPGRGMPERPSSSLAAQAARAAANVAAVPEPKTASVASDFGRTVEPSGNLKDALIAEIKKAKAVFYNMVVAQAQKIEVTGDRVVFSFTPAQRALKDQFEQQKAWLESIAQPIAGRRITMASTQVEGGVAASAPGASDQAAADGKSAEKKSALREQALADRGVQTMLEVFPAEIRDVEEM
jgi:DNA polymerase-3 subunit gamma/tau